MGLYILWNLEQPPTIPPFSQIQHKLGTHQKVHLGFLNWDVKNLLRFSHTFAYILFTHDRGRIYFQILFIFGTRVFCRRSSTREVNNSIWELVMYFSRDILNQPQNTFPYDFPTVKRGNKKFSRTAVLLESEENRNWKWLLCSVFCDVTTVFVSQIVDVHAHGSFSSVLFRVGWTLENGEIITSN